MSRLGPLNYKSTWCRLVSNKPPKNYLFLYPVENFCYPKHCSDLFVELSENSLLAAAYQLHKIAQNRRASWNAELASAYPR